MSELQTSQRSKSAPGLLASSTLDGDVPPSFGQPPLISTPVSEGTQDAFNLEGAFFPRSNSYYALSSMNRSSSGENWVYGSSTTVVTSEAEADPTSSAPLHDRRTTTTTTATSSPLSTLSFPRTPVAPLNLLDDTTLRNRIEAEDRVRGLALTALEKVTEIGFGRQFDGPSYEHDHIFHSYDALHDSFCEKRRSATLPNLAAVAGRTKAVGGVYDSHGVAPALDRKKSSGKVSLLFSPTEEEIDLFGKGILDDDEAEDGKEKDVKEGDSWVTYIYTSAKQLWVRKSASESGPPAGTSSA